MLETSAAESLYAGQFTLSTQFLKPNYLIILPPTQHHIFFKLTPFIFISPDHFIFLSISQASREQVINVLKSLRSGKLIEINMYM